MSGKEDTLGSSSSRLWATRTSRPHWISTLRFLKQRNRKNSRNLTNTICFRKSPLWTRPKQDIKKAAVHHRYINSSNGLSGSTLSATHIIKILPVNVYLVFFCHNLFSFPTPDISDPDNLFPSEELSPDRVNIWNNDSFHKMM